MWGLQCNVLPLHNVALIAPRYTYNCDGIACSLFVCLTRSQFFSFRFGTVPAPGGFVYSNCAERHLQMRGNYRPTKNTNTLPELVQMSTAIVNVRSEGGRPATASRKPARATKKCPLMDRNFSFSFGFSAIATVCCVLFAVLARLGFVQPRGVESRSELNGN